MSVLRTLGLGDDKGCSDPSSYINISHVHQLETDLWALRSQLFRLQTTVLTVVLPNLERQGTMENVVGVTVEATLEITSRLAHDLTRLHVLLPSPAAGMKATTPCSSGGVHRSAFSSTTYRHPIHATRNSSPDQIRHENVDNQSFKSSVPKGCCWDHAAETLVSFIEDHMAARVKKSNSAKDGMHDADIKWLGDTVRVITEAMCAQFEAVNAEIGTLRQAYQQQCRSITDAFMSLREAESLTEEVLEASPDKSFRISGDIDGYSRGEYGDGSVLSKSSLATGAVFDRVGGKHGYQTLGQQRYAPILNEQSPNATVASPGGLSPTNMRTLASRTESERAPESRRPITNERDTLRQKLDDIRLGLISHGDVTKSSLQSRLSR